MLKSVTWLASNYIATVTMAFAVEHPVQLSLKVAEKAKIFKKIGDVGSL